MTIIEPLSLTGGLTVEGIFSGGLLLVVMIVAVFFMSRFMGGPKMQCTRCQGSGSVNEKWPDPAQPGGWHKLDGQCPKCKGKGKV